MEHTEAKELLSAYLDGELQGETKEALEAHLREDPDCARELEELRELVGGLASLADEVTPAPVAQEILKRVQQKIRRRTHGRFYTPMPNYRLPWEVLLVVLGLLLFAAWMLVQPGLLYKPRPGSSLTPAAGGSAPIPITGSPAPGDGSSAAPIRPMPAPGHTAAPGTATPSTGAATGAPSGSRAPLPGADTDATKDMDRFDDGRDDPTPRLGAGSRAGTPVSTLPGSHVLSTPAGTVDVHISRVVERTYTLTLEVEDRDITATRLAVLGMLTLAGDKSLTEADARGTKPMSFAVPRGAFKRFVEQMGRTYRVTVTHTPVERETPSERVSGTIVVR